MFPNFKIFHVQFFQISGFSIKIFQKIIKKSSKIFQPQKFAKKSSKIVKISSKNCQNPKFPKNRKKSSKNRKNRHFLAKNRQFSADPQKSPKIGPRPPEIPIFAIFRDFENFPFQIPI